MTFEEVVQELVAAYHTAPDGRRVVMIHLFGIKCGRDILDFNYSVRELCHAAEVPESYISKIHQGINLSEYVVVRDE